MNYKSTSHIFHFILTLLFFPWVVVWIGLFLHNSRHNNKVREQERRENNIHQERRHKELLEIIAYTSREKTPEPEAKQYDENGIEIR